MQDEISLFTEHTLAVIPEAVEAQNVLVVI